MRQEPAKKTGLVKFSLRNIAEKDGLVKLGIQYILIVQRNYTIWDDDEIVTASGVAATSL